MEIESSEDSDTAYEYQNVYQVETSSSLPAYHNTGI